MANGYKEVCGIYFYRYKHGIFPAYIYLILLFKNIITKAEGELKDFNLGTYQTAVYELLK